MFSRWPRYLQPRARPSRCGRWCTCPGPSPATGRLEVVVAVPRGERREQLDPVARRVDHDLDAAAVGGRSLEARLAGVEAPAGSSSPAGGSRRTSSPASLVSVSVRGSKSSVPASASAITVSGEVDERQRVGVAVVALREVAVVAVDDRVAWPRGRGRVALHCPMHGPQALASTLPPMASRSASRPSRSMVARTCSEPGVTISWVLAVRPLAEAWRAIDAARVMSS